MLLRDEPLGIGYSDVVPGGFAEYLVLSESLLVPVPAGTPFEHAALTEPMAVGLHAVAMARLAGGESVLVLGCGPVGLAVLMALRSTRVGRIAAADFSPARRALAHRLGAERVVDPRSESPFDALGSSPVVVFECVGVPGMIDRIFLGAPRHARVVVVGVCLEPDTSRPLVAINKELNVQYVLGYTVEEFARTLHHIADGTFDVAPLVTGRVGLAGVADAFHALADPEAHAKILVEPGLDAVV
jgi:threonine dehydrogenase-like Zn-dependent dehydrogenase